MAIPYFLSGIENKNEIQKHFESLVNEKLRIKFNRGKSQLISIKQMHRRRMGDISFGDKTCETTCNHS